MKFISTLKLHVRPTSHGLPGSTLDATKMISSIGCDATYPLGLPTCIASPLYHLRPFVFFPLVVFSSLLMSEGATHSFGGYGYADLTPRVSLPVRCERPTCGKLLPPGVELYMLHDSKNSSEGFGVCPDCKTYYENKGSGIVHKRKGKNNLHLVSRTGEFFFWNLLCLVILTG